MDERIWHRGYDPDVPREVEVEALSDGSKQAPAMSAGLT